MACSLPTRNLSRQAFRDHSTAVARRLSVLRARIPDVHRDPQSHRINEFGQHVGAALPGWQPPPFPPHVELAGRYCRLVPLDAEKHARQLFEAPQTPYTQALIAAAFSLEAIGVDRNVVAT